MITAPGQMLPSVGHPAIAWAAAAAVGIPIAIHLFAQLRRTVMPWAAMRFISEAILKHRRRRRVEQWLLLMTRCLLVLVAGLAIAGLLVRGGTFAGAGSALGRHVVVIIDDSLTSRVRAVSGSTRFEIMRNEAMAILEAMRLGDAYAILRAGQPAGELIAPWSTDIDEGRRALKKMAPRYGKSQLVLAVDAAYRHAGQLPPGSPVSIFVLSDLAQGALGTTAVVPPDPQVKADLSWYVRRPETSVENHQIMAFEARRNVVVADGDGRATMQFDMTLRRYTADAPADVSTVHVSAAGASVPVVHRWREGQRLSPRLQVVLPVTIPDADSVVRVSANLEGTTLQRLGDDDQRYCLVEVRSKLYVGIVDVVETRESGSIVPRRWITAALAPNFNSLQRDRDRLELVRINVSELGTAGVSELDALVVLRADRIEAEGYAVLKETAQRGALVVVAAPPQPQPTIWAEALCHAMGVAWQVAPEPVEPGIPLTLAGNRPVPDLFMALAADWEALLRPVRIDRYIAVTPDAAADVWLQLNNPTRRPLMLAGEVGAGRFVLLASAVDESWTNLPTKPLWVPLLHEMVRTAAGNVVTSSRRWLCGDRPSLGPRWRGARRLRFDGISERHEIALADGEEGGWHPASALHAPGIYVGEPGAGPTLAVNIPSDAGDTRTTGEDVIQRCFDTIGQWHWLEPHRPAAGMEDEVPTRDMTFILLAAALLLAVVEAYLASWFSHPPPKAAVAVGGVLRD